MGPVALVAFGANDGDGLLLLVSHPRGAINGVAASQDKHIRYWAMRPSEPPS
jgi:hypothetical protein